MTNFTIPPIMLSISLFSIFVLFILVYLRFTSEFFTSIRFKKSTFVLIFAYVLVFGSSIIVTKKSHSYIRLAIFPPIHTKIAPDETDAWAFAENISNQLSNILTEDYLVYPSNWLIEAIDFDCFSLPNANNCSTSIFSEASTFLSSDNF